MGVRFARAVLGLVVLSSGCTVADATHVLTYQLYQSVGDCAERQRNARWAKEAWVVVAGRSPGVAHSDDYARGFKEGFCEYLYRGSVEPPVLPPKHYRSIHYQTASGYRAIEDWFAGYRHGVAVAHDGNHREWITGPSSLRRPIAPGPPPEVVAPLVPAPGVPASPGPENTTPAPVPLPEPRPVPDAAEGQTWNWRVKVRLDPGEWNWWCGRADVALPSADTR